MTAAPPSQGQPTWIGIGNDPRLGGSVTLTAWQSGGAGIWYYDGPSADVAQTTIESELSTGVCACSKVPVYADDVFYNDQRMLRVLGTAQLGTARFPKGNSPLPSSTDDSSSTTSITASTSIRIPRRPRSSSRSSRTSSRARLAWTE